MHNCYLSCQVSMWEVQCQPQNVWYFRFALACNESLQFKTSLGLCMSSKKFADTQFNRAGLGRQMHGMNAACGQTSLNEDNRVSDSRHVNVNTKSYQSSEKENRLASNKLTVAHRKAFKAPRRKPPWSWCFIDIAWFLACSERVF